MRNNGIYKNKRSAFGIMYGIAVLVLIATIMAYMLEFSSTTSKLSTEEFVKIQSKLYEDSATEWAIFQLQNTNPAPTTTRSYTISFDSAYTYSIIATPLSGDDALDDSRGMVMLDVIGVSLITGQAPGEQIRTHKRVLVKP